MKLDFTKKFVIDGEVTKDGNKEQTYGDLCKSAILLGIDEDQKQLKAEDKYKAYKISYKIDSNADISAEEISLIKKAVGVRYTPMAMGLLWDFLECRNEEVKTS